jgi:signal transduction histidine kinase/CheY-like chemotaxis protein
MEDEKNVNIMLVDDRPEKLLALDTIISDLGRVVKAQSGAEALRQLVKEDFALILLDINMPIMDGFETAALIRQRPRSQHTPIIFITSYGDTDTHISRGYQLGAVDYILAPVIPEVLRAKVSVFVDLFEKTEQIKRQAEERIQLEKEQAARAAAEAAERRSRLLAEASGVLGSSLDYQTALEGLTRLVVPDLADWCAVYILEPEGSMRHLTSAHIEPAAAELLAKLCFRHPGQGSDDGLSRAVRTAQSAWGTSESGTLWEQVGLDPEQAAFSRMLPIRSYILTPLVARQRMLGVILFARAESGGRYVESDLVLAEDLAARAAVAVDNALLYRQASEANRAKDEFLAVMSHELRTPLTPILGWTRRLAQGKLDNTSMRRGIEIIERNVRAQLTMIEDLLDITRISNGKLTLNLRPIDLVEVIDNGVEAVRSAAEAKGIKIDWPGFPAACPMIGDPYRLQQVVWNLVNNAVKFTPNGGFIAVRLEHTGSQIRLSVTDTGAGISPDFLPFVFERFRQGDSTNARTHGGLGLGLAIVRHLVDLHHGSVTASSPGPGKGSTFEVMLHVAVAAHDASSQSPPHRAAAVSECVVRSGS